MRIRAVTYFVSLSDESELPSRLHEAALALETCKAHLSRNLSLEVQTVRVATNPFHLWAKPGSNDKAGWVAWARHMETLIVAEDLQFVSFGPCSSPDVAAFLPDMLAVTQHVSFSFRLDDPAWTTTETEPLPFLHSDLVENSRLCGRLLLNIAKQTPGGNGNFRFAVLSGMEAKCPFFPAAYAASGQTPSISIGLENSDWLHQAADTMESAELDAGIVRGKYLLALQRIVHSEATRIEEAMLHFTMSYTAHSLEYSGLDTSIAPGLEAENAIMNAYQRIVPNIVLDSPGAVAITRSITAILQSAPVLRVGYQGMMWAVLEDPSLAALATSQKLSFTSLLLHSTVCGCGLDCVPFCVAEEEESGEGGGKFVQAVADLYLDVHAMADKLQKPLSARLFPVLDRQNDIIHFHSIYLQDCRPIQLL
jgi:uncharacterized protein